MVGIISLLERRSRRLMKESFKERYGTLIEELRLKGNSFRKKYNAVFLLRRLIYSLLLVGLYTQTRLQLLLCLLVAIVPVQGKGYHSRWEYTWRE